MTLPQVNELMAYWLDHPPLHELAAAYMGYKKHSASTVLPCTKISPMLGQFPEMPSRPQPKPANDLGALVALAKRKGGEISLEMLAGIG